MGSNKFEFNLNDSFFQRIEGSIIEHANIKVELDMVKMESMYDLQFIVTGTISAICDNCLNEVNIPVNTDFQLLMKISEKEDYSDDEIMYITKGVIEYDFSQYLYESVVLSIPARKVCAMAGKNCNEEIVSKINNFDKATEEADGEDNPMWDKLKGIFNNN